MREVVIVGAARTPIGKFGGSLKDVPTRKLGAICIEEALKRAGVAKEDVDEVIMGCVLQAGLGQNVTRQMMLDAGLPVEIPCFTINKVCGSGLRAVALAAQAIKAGDADIIVAGGAENMSASPYVMPAARWGARMFDAKMVDVMVNDGLWDAFNQYHMGVTAENVAEQWGITREELDEFAVTSQQRAEAAVDSGRFDDEIVPVTIPQRKGDPIVFSRDEHLTRGSTMEKVAKLRPAFKKDGGVYSCDHFVDPAHRIGSVKTDSFQDLLSSEFQSHFGQSKKEALTRECLSCPHLSLCGGGCLKDRFALRADGEEGQYYLCPGLQSFFDYAVPRLQAAMRLSAQKKTPFQIQSLLVTEERARFAGVGRNDPCPCGSGLKFKFCCQKRVP